MTLTSLGKTTSSTTQSGVWVLHSGTLYEQYTDLSFDDIWNDRSGYAMMRRGNSAGWDKYGLLVAATVVCAVVAATSMHLTFSALSEIRDLTQVNL